MNEFKKKQWTRIALSLIAVIMTVLFLTGVIGGKPMTYQLEEPLTPMLQGITDTMAQNAENSAAEDYLEQDPYLVNIYEGFGFAKDYMAARGHAYTLEDVTKTQRPHGKANCITCKTPDYTKLVNEKGVEAYSLPFDEVIGQMTQAISCYTCHGDDKGNNGQIVITHSYVEKALGENASSIDPKTLNCGQCHIEYYFTPENSETMMPYSDQDGMTPEAILAYYDEMDFKDWEQPGTGTAMLKAQHPEMETFLPSQHAKMGLTCSSCHMAEETAEDGSTYHSHYLVSPLASDTLMETCAACHGSAESARTLVAATQEKVTARETEVGNRLSTLKDTLTEAVTEAKMTEEELDAVRKLHREAQWFFDFCYVENSEGAHNSKLSIRCLDTADEKITEAMALLTGETPVQEEPETLPSDNTAAAVLEATEQGFGGDVTVYLELNEDRTVKSLTIDTPNETPGFGQRASEAAFTEQFIGKTGPFTYGEDGIEALSGATFTSNAVLKAINGLIADENTDADQPAEENQPAEGQKVETNAAAADDSGTAGQVYGSYMSEKETVFSTIRVTVSTKNDVITECTVRCDAKEGQTDLVTDENEEAWAKAIVETQGAEIDTVSGATISSDAVREAVAEIRQQIGGGKQAEKSPEESVEEPSAETVEEKKDETASSGQVYGSYMSEKETIFSTIRVTVSTKNDVITECTVRCDAKEGQTDLVTDENEKAWAKAVVETQGTEIDTVTGATVSSDAVREAVAEIRQQIAGEFSAVETPAEELTETPAEEPAEAAAEEPAEGDAEAEKQEQPAEEQPAEEPVETETATVPALFGGYLAVRETEYSVIRVIVSTRNGVITDCRILCDAKEGQVDLVKDENEAAWAKAVIETQGTELDTVTGATVSSDAVREAVAEILERIR